MIRGINHVGLVVNSIDETLEMLHNAFGAIELGRKSFPEMGQTSCIMQLGDSQFELMEPIGENGVVPKFLREHGQGLHHISLISDDLNADYEAIAGKGMRLIGDVNGALRVVFTHPKQTGNVIYEITDKPFAKEEKDPPSLTGGEH